MMRVYEVCFYNLKQIRFKENKEFFEGLLRDFGYSYTDIAFTFQYGPCEKVAKFFPELNQYKRHYDHIELSSNDLYSSVFADENDNVSLHIDHDHHASFGLLLKKIPNPINFGFMGVALDNVNWYGDEAQNSVFPKHKSSLVGDSRFRGYYSNSIRFYKEFDYGNKLNVVDIMIDRTGEANGLRPYPARFEELLSTLGKPKSKELKCIFDETERLRLDAQRERIRGLTKEKEAFYNEKYQCFPQETGMLDWAIANNTPIKGFSPKTVLNGCAKGTGYRYAGFQDGSYRFHKTDTNNHLFRVEFDTGAFSSRVAASVWAIGYNFEHELCQTTVITVKEEADLLAYAKMVFETAAQMEADWSDELLASYGKTPDWFAP